MSSFFKLCRKSIPFEALMDPFELSRLLSSWKTVPKTSWNFSQCHWLHFQIEPRILYDLDSNFQVWAVWRCWKSKRCLKCRMLMSRYLVIHKTIKRLSQMSKGQTDKIQIFLKKTRRVRMNTDNGLDKNPEPHMWHEAIKAQSHTLAFMVLPVFGCHF